MVWRSYLCRESYCYGSKFLIVSVNDVESFLIIKIIYIFILDREAADKVVSGSGKFEQLMVASQGIAASTAQLVVASRVKANRNSNNLSALSEASREVTQATASVVATAKSCSQLVEETGERNEFNEIDHFSFIKILYIYFYSMVMPITCEIL